VFVDFIMNWLVLSMDNGELDNEISEEHIVSIL